MAEAWRRKCATSSAMPPIRATVQPTDWEAQSLPWSGIPASSSKQENYAGIQSSQFRSTNNRMIILDTNVISALMNDPPEDRVVAWLDHQAPSSIWTNSV